MIYFIDVMLGVLVVIGSMTIAWGGRRFRLSTSVTTIAFAITAVSWVAFIIMTIGVTMRLVVMPNA